MTKHSKSDIPSWDETWMELAYNISKHSKDTKHKVGCIIVTSDNTSVLSLGYNGDEKGGTNKRDSSEHSKSGFIHAEANALIKLNYSDPRDKKMYLTMSPCITCARMIINAGIKEVIYSTPYYDDLTGVRLLENCEHTDVVQYVNFL